jgi:RimJ/RimL family protein N-acetyltransferase
MKTDVFWEFRPLETERLILRELKPTDAEAIFHYLSDPEVTQYLDTQPHQTVEQTQRLVNFLASLFEKGEGFRWGIVKKTGNSGQGADVVIGTCGYHAWVKFHLRAEIGYELAREYWGQGIMSEAIKAILAFGFDELGLNRVEAMVLVGNVASARFLEKLGFQQEGVLREYKLVQRAFKDLMLFSLLKKDYWASQR